LAGAESPQAGAEFGDVGFADAAHEASLPRGRRFSEAWE
jgi:hypothetical protein